MQAGTLRKRITLQARSIVQDGLGQQVATWTDVSTIWASIEPLGGRELMLAQAIKSESTHKVQTRYRPGVTAAMRIKYGSRIFNIQNVMDEEERHRLLIINCNEGLNDG